jgi:hypothetical protein
MPTAQLKIQDKDSCQCCAYVLGGDSAHQELHCGYVYFQQPARARKVVRLSSFPPVKAEHKCRFWELKAAR